jgi:tRNA pseudouridine55 synthase
MARNRIGTPIHGWIVLDKPLGMSSAAAVGAVRRITGAAKAGHGGTLDPLASGVLPVALGEATKTVSYAMEGVKRYGFTIRWGEARDTDDAEGHLVGESSVRPVAAEIEAALPALTGRILQVPPAYSAIKIGGKRAYARARAGETFVLTPRHVSVGCLLLTGLPDVDHASFEASVGKGTYIRTLARDLASALGTLGHVAALRRLAVGPFGLGQAISLENLAALGHNATSSEHLLPIETPLDDIPAMALTEADASALRHGRSVKACGAFDRASMGRPIEGATVRAMDGGKFVALAKIQEGRIYPVRVLNF